MVSVTDLFAGLIREIAPAAPSAAYLKFLHHKRRIRSRNFK